jgi:hypothetical protein
VQDGYGVVFAFKVQVFIEEGRVAIQMLIGARKLSRYCYFVNSTGAVSRYNVDRSQKTVKVYRIYVASNGACPGADSSRICLGSSACKNHDEPIDYTVRVIRSLIYLFV